MNRWIECFVKNKNYFYAIILSFLVFTILFWKQIYTSEYPASLTWFLLIISYVFIIFVMLDMAIEALGLDESPTRSEEKLENFYPEIKNIKNKTALGSIYLKTQFLEDIYSEIEAQWWSKKAYVPLLRIGILFGKIFIIILFFTTIHISVIRLLAFQVFTEITDYDIIDFVYIACQSVLLTGSETIQYAQLWTKIISIACFATGLFILGICVNRLIAPADQELIRYRAAIEDYFRKYFG